MMRRVAVLAGVIGVLAVVGMSGCGVARHELDEDRTEEASITEVRVSGGGGSLTVQTGEGGTTKIVRHVRYHGNRPGSTDRMDGSALEVRTGCGNNCSVDYTITLPARAKVTGHNSSGRIDLRRVSTVSLQNQSGSIVVRDAAGPVSVQTSSGSIELSDVQGDATVRTSSGSVTLTGIAGAVVAGSSSGRIRAVDLRGAQTSVQSSSGSITVEPAQPQGVYAEASSGSIVLRLPEGSYRVRTQTSSGRVAGSVASDPAGTHLVDVHTSSGGITISGR